MAPVATLQQVVFGLRHSAGNSIDRQCTEASAECSDQSKSDMVIIYSSNSLERHASMSSLYPILLIIDRVSQFKKAVQPLGDKNPTSPLGLFEREPIHKPEKILYPSPLRQLASKPSDCLRDIQNPEPLIDHAAQTSQRRVCSDQRLVADEKLCLRRRGAKSVSWQALDEELERGVSC